MDNTQFVFDAIGTHWVIDIESPLTSNKESVLKKISKRISQFDKDYSRFREDSLVFKMSQKAGMFKLPEDAQKMFDLYEKIYKITNGLVTPLIASTLEEAGYDAKYSLKEREVHAPATWKEVMSYEYPDLTIKKPVMLDFGAAGKGYLVDIVGDLLETQGIQNFCIDAGGDILHKGKTSLKVGLEHPEDAESVIGVVNLMNGSICGSAGNRRKWANYHHIINPQTLKSPKNILSVWTTASEAIIADAMSTCLFFMEGKEMKKYFEFEYFILYADYTFDKSNGFEAELFL